MPDDKVEQRDFATLNDLAAMLVLVLERLELIEARLNEVRQ